MKGCSIFSLVFFMAVASCGLSSKSPNAEKANPISLKIEGEWYLNKWTMYHTLVFRDSSLYADNTVDTLYMFNYEIKQDTLFSSMGNQHYKNGIVKLSDDSLVVDGIFDAKERRIYSRVNTGFR